MKRRQPTRRNSRTTAKTPTAKRSLSIKYKKNFLRHVIARVDFSKPLPLIDTKVAKLHKEIKALLPLQEKSNIVKEGLVVSGVSAQRTREELPRFIFKSKDEKRRASVEELAMYVEHFAYSTFEAFMEDFSRVFTAIQNIRDDLMVERIGLRYVNHIELKNKTKPTEWKQYLHEDLLGGFQLADDRSTISRCVNVVHFNYGDSQMKFQFGMPNPDFPATIKKKMFVLDYDIFESRSVGMSVVSEKLDQFHDKINASFEQVITDGLRKVMGRVNG